MKYVRIAECCKPTIAIEGSDHANQQPTTAFGEACSCDEPPNESVDVDPGRCTKRSPRTLLFLLLPCSTALGLGFDCS